MTIPIGVMQGRLSPPSRGRIQSFPVDSWRDEFELARQAGLACIEWIYEADTEQHNPIGTTAGIGDMRRLADVSGVAVRSVCADYYMERHLLAADGRPDAAVVAHLAWLIGQAAQLGCAYMVLPFVDASRLATAAHLDGLAQALGQILPEAAARQVELHLETDLEPAELAALLRRADHPSLRANLDTGNSASLGHDPRVELAEIGPWLGSVHIKDRVLGGGTVPLGTGNADLPAYFELLSRLPYRGTFILQVARSDDMPEVDWCCRNRELVEAGLRAVPAGG